MIQVAGAQKIIDTAPELLFEKGNYSVVPSFFGANKQEGTLVLGCKYIRITSYSLMKLFVFFFIVYYNDC